MLNSIIQMWQHFRMTPGYDKVLKGVVLIGCYIVGTAYMDQRRQSREELES